MVFENEIQNPYLRSLLILFLVFLILKIVVLIIERVFVRFSKKTKTDVDDVIIERTSKPISIFLFMIGVWFAVDELPFYTGFVSDISDKIIYSLIIFVVGYILFLIVDTIISRSWKRVAIRTKSRIDESLSSIFNTILGISWVVLAFLYVLTVWNVEIGPFLAGLGIAGLAVALALQPTLSNIFSGISMVLDKSVRVGDLIYLDNDTKGEILHVGIRSTKMKTFDNELIIVPNTKLADSKIQNVALPEPKSRVVIPFGVAYGSDIQKVKKLVLSEIMKLEHLVKDPEPSVRFLEMGTSSLNFKAYFYVDSYQNRFESIDKINELIYNALNKNKISIPFPQMDVHLKKE